MKARLLTAAIGIPPVSYTHLDVYKRQEWWETILRGEYQDYYEHMYANRGKE